jgi:uncharacterized membrane protein YesL
MVQLFSVKGERNMKNENLNELKELVGKMITEICQNNLRLQEWEKYFQEYKKLFVINQIDLANSLGRVLNSASVLLTTDVEELTYNNHIKELQSSLGISRILN